MMVLKQSWQGICAALCMAVALMLLPACSDREEAPAVPEATEEQGQPLYNIEGGEGEEDVFAIKEALVTEATEAPFIGPGWEALWHPELAWLLSQRNPPTRQWALPLWEVPEDESLLVGTLIIDFSAEKGLTARFQPNGGRVVPFVPDLYDQDWGYGPWFHHTVLETKGGWAKFPKNPFPTPVWVNLDAAFGDVAPISVYPGEVYVFNGKNVVITEMVGDRILMRPEQPADMPCEGNEPPIKEVTPTVLHRSDLFDADGHLKLTVAHMRGC